VVVYGGDDRRSGRIYKWVSSANYTEGMTKAQMRALLDDGALYVSHFAGLDNTTGNTMLATGSAPTAAAPGMGTWIHLSVDSMDIAPNATALGLPNTTVGAALKSTTYNGIGGFPTDDDAYRTLFTASNKIGIMELNRPEDIEYNPVDISGAPRIYVSFTNNNKKVALDQSGKLYAPATHAMMSPTRADLVGAIFAIVEAMPNDPAASKTFSFFDAWHGSKGKGNFDAANPDNIAIDREGGVWFGTDGNFAVNGMADSLYYLDLDPKHAAGQAGVMAPSFGLAFRIAAVPSDAETTGPAFSSDMRTLFFSVQHPGEDVYSTWPDGGASLSSVVAINFSEK
jgi:secreted PhoX family phosphatase